MTISELVGSLRDSSDATRAAAIKLLFRRAQDSASHADIETSDPELKLIQMMAAGQSGTSYRDQLFAIACLQIIWLPQNKSLEFEICQETVRAPTKADLSALAGSLGTTSATALVEALEAVECLVGCFPPSSMALLQTGVVAKIVRLLRHGDINVLIAVASTIGTLVRENLAAATEIINEPTVLPLLVTLVNTGTDDQKLCVAYVITCLAEHDQLLPKLGTTAIMDPIVTLLRAGAEMQQSQALSALSHLIKAKDGGVVVAVGGVQALVEMLQVDTGDKETKKLAKELLLFLLTHGHADQVIEANCVASAIALLGEKSHGQIAVELLKGLINSKDSEDPHVTGALDRTAFTSLVRLLSSGDDEQKAHVLKVLLRVARCKILGRRGFMRRDLLEAMVKVLRSGPLNLKLDVARVFRCLTKDLRSTSALCSHLNVIAARNALANLPSEGSHAVEVQMTLGQLVLASEPRSMVSPFRDVDANGLVVGKWVSKLEAIIDGPAGYMAMICPGIVVAQIFHRVGIANYYCVLTLFIILHFLALIAVFIKNPYLIAVVVLLALCAAGTVALLRMSIRSALDLPGSEAEDCAVAYFFGWCAIAQMAVQVEAWEPNSCCSVMPRDTLPGYA